jgi:hypothetical protein
VPEPPGVPSRMASLGRTVEPDLDLAIRRTVLEGSNGPPTASKAHLQLGSLLSLLTQKEILSDIRPILLREGILTDEEAAPGVPLNMKDLKNLARKW